MSEDYTEVETAQNPLRTGGNKLRTMKWIIFTLLILCLLALYIPATLSQAHLDADHVNWNGRPVPPPVEVLEGAIDEIVMGQDGGEGKGKETASSITEGSYDEAIREKKEFIERIDSSFKQFQCLPIDPLFHYYFPEPIIQIEFATYDEVLVPTCDNPQSYKWSGNRENIAVWNRRRTVTEWALHALLPNENVLYFRPGVYNHVELISISRLVGANGRVYVLGYEQGRRCFEKTQRANEALSNVQFIAAEELPNVGYLNALIAHESIFKDGPIAAFPVPAFTKMLLFCEDGQEAAKTFRNFKVEKVLLRDKPCGTAVFTAGQGRGFFSFTSAGMPPKRRMLAKYPTSHLVFSEYDKYKLQHRKRLAAELATLEKYAVSGICRPSTQTAKEVMTVYGHQLTGASLKEVQSWEDQRQPIEWARQHQLQGDIYYEMRAFNLLAILELSFLLENRLLIVVCAEYCGRIQGHQRANMVLLPVSYPTAALKAAAIVTDNSSLIRQSLADGFLQRGALLAFLAGENGLLLMRQLFVAHHLREVVLPKQKGHCLGFTYLHQFWNSEEPNGFYDVSASKLGSVAYAFWGGKPSQVSLRKKLLLDQMTSSSVEVKIVGSRVFRFFQVEGSPIHAAFQLLSPVHQSDYFRIYMMHNYGGIYLDIKHTHIDPNDFLKRLHSSDKILISGSPNGPALCYLSDDPTPCWIITSMYKKMFSNQQFAMKKGTKATAEWLRRVNLILDGVYQELKRNPAQANRESRGSHQSRKDGTRFISRYPIEWIQINGDPQFKVQFQYLENIDISMPVTITIDYNN